ncbi:type 4a pilus biogenesis protein PilO [Candidatus Ozemobacteraceae bacterium]|nr:type 4a pilus biogenesis protein PilO [Candidatus Ozemobacteraceae bacterium]
MNQQIVIVLLVISLALVGYDWQYNQTPRQIAVAAQEQTNEKLRQDLNTALDAKAKIATLQAEIKKTQTLSAELSKQLPKRSEAGALLEQITTTSVTKRMRIDSVTPAALVAKSVGIRLAPNDPVAQVKYEEMELSLEMHTFYRDLGAYLETLEKIPRLIDVDGLQVTAPVKPGPLGIKMRVKTYICGG